MEPPAIGPKMRMMEVFFMMTLNTHGINAGSKEEKPDERKRQRWPKIFQIKIHKKGKDDEGKGKWQKGLLDERETHIEYQKSRKKVLHKDNWRTEKKRFSDKMEEFWKGKTVYKIKKD